MFCVLILYNERRDLRKDRFWRNFFIAFVIYSQSERKSHKKYLLLISFVRNVWTGIWAVALSLRSQHTTSYTTATFLFSILVIEKTLTGILICFENALYAVVFKFYWIFWLALFIPFVRINLFPYPIRSIEYIFHVMQTQNDTNINTSQQSKQTNEYQAYKSKNIYTQA